MDLSRINYLRESLEEEVIDLEELSEIETAFAEIPDNELPEPRENAMAIDMLNELEARVTPLERSLYQYILENYGENEANDPCYSLGPIVHHIYNNFTIGEKK